MIKFINNDLLIKKNINKLIFYEKINVAKLNYIINNYSKYEEIIKEQEKDMRRKDKNYNVLSILNKIRDATEMDNIEDEIGYIKVEYSKGRNSNGIGRWYAKNGVGLQPLTGCIRHTICNGIWVDIDQVNSHPTIFHQKMTKYDFKSPLLDECLNNRENFLKKIMNDEKCDRDDAKTRVIAVINGAKYTSPTLKQLCKELKPAIQYINNLPEYSSIVEYVNKTYQDDNNIDGKIISRILQIIENDLLECYLQFFYDNNLIPEMNKDGLIVSLIFDGFQVLINKTINQEFLDKCRNDVFDKTGYDVELKVKPFDNPLKLPDNYAYRDDDLQSLIQKYNRPHLLSKYIESYSYAFDNCIREDGSHSSIGNICKMIFKDIIVFDENTNLWFYSNTKNIWKKSKSPFILSGLIKSFISDLFKFYSGDLYCKVNEINKKYTDKNDMSNNDKEKIIALEKEASKCCKISLNLHNMSFIENIVKCCKIDFNKDKFFEKCIDSKGSLFAFNNKVFSCRTKEIRDIRPDDYIMTTGGYDYPENINENNKIIIEKYYKTIYPNPDVYEYMWDNDALSIDGERTTQTFNIHTGNGSNSKSTKLNMIKSVLGEYFIEMNAETFTKPPRSSNATSELYRAKGTRIVFFNEPESDGDNKLQVGLMKKMADGYKSILKARGLYSEMIEFPVFFRVEFACNSKPTLSSVDGGIGRRIRVIHYPVKFISDPNPENINQALLNPDMVNILTSDDIRNTYIRMLIDRFINNASNIRNESIPRQIKEDSNEYIEDCNIVLGFIMDKYEITNNEEDKIQSSALFNDFKIKTNAKMTASKFKDDIFGISGITNKRLKSGIYFCGLKEKIETKEDIDE